MEGRGPAHVSSLPRSLAEGKVLGQRAEMVVQQVFFCSFNYQIPSRAGGERDDRLMEPSNPAVSFPRHDEPGLVRDGWGLLALMGSTSSQAARLHDSRDTTHREGSCPL